jgi:hypothetical protein
MTEQVAREGGQITMCWLAEGHPLVDYARRPSSPVVHLFNFVHSTRAKEDTSGWVNAALFAELLARVEGDRIDATLRGAVERGLMRPQEHGKRAGYVLEPTHVEARSVLGEFELLNGGQPVAPVAVPSPVPSPQRTGSPAATFCPTARQ